MGGGMGGEMDIRGVYRFSSQVKNKRRQLRCLLLHRKKKNIFFIFMKSLLWKKFKNGPLITTVSGGLGLPPDRHLHTSSCCTVSQSRLVLPDRVRCPGGGDSRNPLRHTPLPYDTQT
jgi:hypothetical protein